MKSYKLTQLTPISDCLVINGQIGIMKELALLNFLRDNFERVDYSYCNFVHTIMIYHAENKRMSYSDVSTILSILQF